MGVKRSKAPKPDYQAMANRLAQWQHEDAEWHRISLDEAKNVHNRELGRAKARYAASGGNKNKIAEIEAEHKRKLQETEAGIEKQYKQKQSDLRSGPTYRLLRERFGAIVQQEILKEHKELSEKQDKFGQVRGIQSLQDFEKERGIRVRNIPYQNEDVAGQAGQPSRRIMFMPDSPVVSEEAFGEWVNRYGQFTRPVQKEFAKEEIKTRQGERPRKPIVGLPTEQNPWI